MDSARILFGLSLLAALGGCALDPPTGADAGALGPGVIFTYPANGQLDVPVGAQLVLRFSAPVDRASAAAPCTGLGPGAVAGSLCLVGPQGLVSPTITVSGDTGGIVTLDPQGLAPGATYQLYARPALLDGAAVNLPSQQPLLTFTTRSRTPIARAAPTLLAVNGESPESFATPKSNPPLPFLTVSSLRLLFSEPLDERTVVQGHSFSVSRMDPARGTLQPVTGTLLLDGIHLTFDPDQDLDPTATYEVDLSTSFVILDRGGEGMAPTTFYLRPQSPSGLFPQTLAVWDPATGGGPGAQRSALSGRPENSIQLSSPLVGRPTLGLLGGSVQALLADPNAFGGPIPFVVRKGQSLQGTPLNILFGGQVASGVSTGALTITFLADATGFMVRNPYRPSDTPPDDQASPTLVDLVFDAALAATDPLGNVIATQTLMGVHLLGTAVASGGQLSIDSVGTLELDALGIAQAPGQIDMHLASSAGGSVAAPLSPPLSLLSSYPVQGEVAFPTDGNLLLTFSAPPSLESLQAPGALVLSNDLVPGTPLPFGVSVMGSIAVIEPLWPFVPGDAYTLQVGSLQDVNGNPLLFSPLDATNGTGTLAFSTPVLSTNARAAPLLTALIPGAPCALAGATAAGPGHCVGGQGGDASYLPFTLPADRPVLAFFSQPIDPNTLTLGTGCGQGSVRVEAVDASGNCLAPVPGTLLPHARAFTFIPNTPFTPGQTYQLTLISGPDDLCDPGEICGLAGEPLNTDPLDGIASGMGGGPDLVQTFTAVPAGDQTLDPLGSVPVADTNGNGVIDPGELADPGNQLAIEIVGTSGIVTSASLNGPDCLPDVPGTQVCAQVRADLPVSVEPPIAHCPMDVNGNPVADGGPCVPVHVSAQMLESTSLSLNATAGLVFSFSNVPTGMMVMRGREPAREGMVGYILDDPGSGLPQFVLFKHLYIDAPDLKILGGTVSHDLHSKSLDILVRGPVTFRPDGRMQVLLSNVQDVPLSVTLSSLGLTGGIQLLIPAGQLHFTLVGPPRR